MAFGRPALANREMLQTTSPFRSARSVRSRERGAADRALLILGAVGLLSAIIVLVPDPGRAETEAEVKALHSFLEEGPRRGTWRVKGLSRARTAYFAPHPADPQQMLMGRPSCDGEGGSDDPACSPPCAYSIDQVKRFFYEGPPSLFFENYVQAGPPVVSRSAEGHERLCLTWVPRHHPDALTERKVWFDRATKQVLRIEDLARDGKQMRGVEFVSSDTGSWDPDAFDPNNSQHCRAFWPHQKRTPAEQLTDVCDEAPFAVFAPRYVPRGYHLLSAVYRDHVQMRPPAGRDPSGSSLGGQQLRRVRMVSLLYSDGVGIISIGVAPAIDMNAIERLYGAMSQSGDSDPEACPGLPAEPKELQTTEGLVRMRTDTCRTVLRRDGLDGVSVTVLCRNELPLEEYLHVIGSLQRVCADPNDTER